MKVQKCIIYLIIACKEGWYGENCSKQCPMHCKESTFCNRSSGQCDEGCKNGWHDMDCTQQCVGHCRDGSYCNQMTGQCDAGCGAGWTGVFCEKGRVLGVYKDLYFSVSDYYHIVHSDLPT